MLASDLVALLRLDIGDTAGEMLGDGCEPLPMRTVKYGQWKQVKRVLVNCLPARMEKALNRAATKCALLLVREIKKGIKAQAPGGKKFAPLTEATIDKKGSSKALKGNPLQMTTW